MLRKGLNNLQRRQHVVHGIAKGAHVQLANTCLRYLATEEIRVAYQERQLWSGGEFRFLAYVATNWLPYTVTAERETLGHVAVVISIRTWRGCRHSHQQKACPHSIVCWFIFGPPGNCQVSISERSRGRYLYQDKGWPYSAICGFEFRTSPSSEVANEIDL